MQHPFWGEIWKGTSNPDMNWWGQTPRESLFDWNWWYINPCRLFNTKSIFTQMDRSIAIQFSQTVLIQTIQFSISIVFVYTQLNVKTVLFQAIQLSWSTVSISKTVLFQTVQFSISTQFKCWNSSISSNIV